MKSILICLIALGSISSIASTTALVCENGELITKAEAINISIAKNEEKIEFDESKDSLELIKQVTERIEKRSPLLAQMFANLYLKVTDEDNINLGNFVLPATAYTQLYRICGTPTQVPKLVGVSKQEKTLKIDQTVFNKLNDLNKTAVILNEVIHRLTLQIEEDIWPFGNVQKYVSYLLAKDESQTLHQWTDYLNYNLVLIPISSHSNAVTKAYYAAGSFEDAKKALENQTVKLSHDVETTVEIKETNLEPYQLAKLKRDGIPLDPNVIFWGIPGGFISSMAVSGISNAAVVIFSGGAAAIGTVGATVIITAGVTLGAGVTAYGIIVNTIYSRKLKIISQAYDLVKGDTSNKRLLNRFYRQFRKKVNGVGQLEYAQRIIDLSYKNAFGKGKGKFVGALKMKEIIIDSFN